MVGTNRALPPSIGRTHDDNRQFFVIGEDGGFECTGLPPDVSELPVSVPGFQRLTLNWNSGPGIHDLGDVEFADCFARTACGNSGIVFLDQIGEMDGTGETCWTGSHELNIELQDFAFHARPFHA